LINIIEHALLNGVIFHHVFEAEDLIHAEQLVDAEVSGIFFWDI
jgi:hypothetical protein